MHLFYCDDFVLSLPPDHRFPMVKYAQLRQRILAEGVATEADMHVPEGVTDEQILRCHDAEYLHKVKHGFLTTKEIRRIGFPWSPELLQRSRHSSGGTLGATLSALENGTGVNLAGGTHHACPDHGEGFCVFNDVAITARALQDGGYAERVLIVDLDVHQGNGTAAITNGDPTIFTLSVHGEKNFPFRKVAGDIDIGLPNGTEDAAYIDVIRGTLPEAIRRANADVAIYIAGADPFVGDRLGKLALTKAGIAARDRYVFETCHAAGLPVGVAMGGGYAPDVNDIVDVHLGTIREAAAAAVRWKRAKTEVR
jgi:acetoin utilization deacetylase AcuC-like enzyme